MPGLWTRDLAWHNNFEAGATCSVCEMRLIVTGAPTDLHATETLRDMVGQHMRIHR